MGKTGKSEFKQFIRSRRIACDMTIDNGTNLVVTKKVARRLYRVASDSRDNNAAFSTSGSNRAALAEHCSSSVARSP
jgi:hypothetical protein